MKAILISTVLAMTSTSLFASEPSPSIDRNDQMVLSTDTFLNAHPDMKYRTEGWFAYEAGRYEEALSHFEKAAEYGDKLSQAMLAEMLWSGLGASSDRPLAYVWADLAAERGYVDFVVLREQLWRELTDAERHKAIAQGTRLVARYGDAVALERMAKHLRKARRYMIGNRVRRDVDVHIPTENGGLTIRGSDFYAAKFWEPERYQEWVDARWEQLPRGRVEVRELETVRESAPQDTQNSSRGEPEDRS